MTEERKFPPLPEHYPEVLGDMADKLAELFLLQGKEPAEAWDIAFNAAETVRADWGGALIYIPKGDAFELDEEAQQIFNEFKNRNYEQLARKYKRSVPHVYRVVKKMQAKMLRERQQPLF